MVTVPLYVNAWCRLILSINSEICATIYSAKNFKISSGRMELTRSAVCLIFSIVLHADGKLHVFEGSDDFRGCAYLCVRLYWTGFGFWANIVEEFLLLSIFGCVRTWDQKLSSGLVSGQLNSALDVANVNGRSSLSISLRRFCAIFLPAHSSRVKARTPSPIRLDTIARVEGLHWLTQGSLS